MALEIGGDVGPVTIELVGGLHDDLRPSLPGARAVLVDPMLDAHVHPLRVLAAQRGGAPGPVGPLATDHDDAIAVGHLGMDDIALPVGQDLARLEAEGFFQPLERGAIVLVGEGGRPGGAVRRWSWQAPVKLSMWIIFNHSDN